ncbi:MAG TPA: PEP-CTERM sorting domain-containing protein [Pseudorhodoferax sp.]|jgi:hypothetical protein|nr:PEP-CTERM sorting domain-containing protein [Pseudorhodoferax sp.]
MQFLPAAGLALSLFAAAPAMAAPLVIDFETAPSYDSIGNHYADKGVSFGGGVLGLQNDELGPYFSNAPSAKGVMFTFGDDATMNVADGFSDAISFWYSSTAAAFNAVNIWSGLNGTGTLLASFDLLGNAQNGCDDTAWCHFDQLSASFAGVAYSLSFNGDPSIAFDNIALGSNDVPEPASMLLVSLGLAGLAASKRRRR